MIKFKKTILTLLTTTTAIAPMVVVSCSNEQKDWVFDGGSFNGKDWKMNVIPWDKITHVDATLESWIDGDTPIVNFDKPMAGMQKDVHIRVEYIDTPELHVAGGDGKINVLTKGKEYEYAEKARVFGANEIKPGDKIRIATVGDTSYDRIVGAIFYGKNFEKSYEVNILAAGLAYPFKSDITQGLDSKSSLNHYLAIPAADAYNYALNSKVGLYSSDAKGATVVHGATNVTPFQWKNHGFYGSTNVYAYVEGLGYKL